MSNEKAAKFHEDVSVKIFLKLLEEKVMLDYTIPYANRKEETLIQAFVHTCL